MTDPRGGGTSRGGRADWGERVSIDRAALIEAAAKVIRVSDADRYPLEDYRREHEASRVLDAVLPLIANLIEDPIRLGESVHYEFCSLVQAAELVRGLATRTGDDG
jgi:hypothetical protein